MSSTSIMVSWEEIPPFDWNGIIIAYEVLYEPLNTFGGLLEVEAMNTTTELFIICLLYTSPSPRDATLSRMPSSA